MKSAVEAETNQSYTTFEAVKYTSQVVAGTNYIVKFRVGADEYIHVKIFVPLPVENLPNQVTGVQTDGVTETSPIEAF